MKVRDCKNCLHHRRYKASNDNEEQPKGHFCKYREYEEIAKILECDKKEIFININDKNTPIRLRKEALADWLVKEKGVSRTTAKIIADKRIGQEYKGLEEYDIVDILNYILEEVDAEEVVECLLDDMAEEVVKYLLDNKNEEFIRYLRENISVDISHTHIDCVTIDVDADIRLNGKLIKEGTDTIYLD